MKEELNSDELSGLLCSGIVPLIIFWINKDFIKGRDGDSLSIEDFIRAKDLIKEKSTYTYIKNLSEKNGRSNQS